MAIDKIAFGKNLRPSTIDVMNKVNEVIDALNNTDASEIEHIKSDIETLKQTDTNLSAQITELQELEPRVKANEDDLENVKITLYTPLQSDE